MCGFVNPITVTYFRRYGRSAKNQREELCASGNSFSFSESRRTVLADQRVSIDTGQLTLKALLAFSRVAPTDDTGFS